MISQEVLIVEKTVFSLRINKDLYDWFKEEAEKRSMSVNALISFLMSEYKRDQE